MRLEAAAALALAALGWSAPQEPHCVRLQGRIGGELHCRHDINPAIPAHDASPAARRVLLDGPDGGLVIVASPAQIRFADSVRPRVKSDNQGASERMIEDLIDDEWALISPAEQKEWRKDSNREPSDNHEGLKSGVGGSPDSTKSRTEDSSTTTSSVARTTTTSSSESTTTPPYKNQSWTTSRRKAKKPTGTKTVESSWTSKTQSSSAYSPARTSTPKTFASASNHTTGTVSPTTAQTTSSSTASRTNTATARTRKSTTTTKTLNPTSTRTRTLAPILGTGRVTRYTNTWPRPTHVVDPYDDEDDEDDEYYRHGGDDEDDEDDEYYRHGGDYEDWELVGPLLRPSRTSNPGYDDSRSGPSRVAFQGGDDGWETRAKSPLPLIPTQPPIKSTWLPPQDAPPGRSIFLEDKLHLGSSHKVRPSLDVPNDKLAHQNAPSEGWPRGKPEPGMQTQAQWLLPPERPAQGVILQGLPSPNLRAGAGTPDAAPWQSPKSENIPFDDRPKTSHGTESETQPSFRTKNPGGPKPPSALPTTLISVPSPSPQGPNVVMGSGPVPTPRQGGTKLQDSAFPIPGQQSDQQSAQIRPAKTPSGQADKQDGSRYKPNPELNIQVPWALETGGEKRPQNVDQQPAKPYSATPGASPASNTGATINHRPGGKSSEQDGEEWDVFVHPATGKKIYTGGDVYHRDRERRPRGNPGADTFTQPPRDARPRAETSARKLGSWRRSEREKRNRRRSRSRGESL